MKKYRYHIAVLCIFLCLTALYIKDMDMMQRVSETVAVQHSDNHNERGVVVYLRERESSLIVNINSADKEQLMALPYIGEVKAQAILVHRGENGAFLSVDELSEVDGIGRAIVDKIRHFLTV